MRPHRIFISYRHAESAFYAGRLSEQLEAHFGSQVAFIDTEGIKPGRDYMEVIGEKIRSCKILIAVIGPQWLTCSNENGRRLDDPEDVVRLEISEALRQGVRVIPVLIQGATVPRAQDLPEALTLLARRQASRVSDDHWRQDVKRLIEEIEEDITPQPEAGLPAGIAPGARVSRLKKSDWAIFGGALVVAIVYLVLTFYIFGNVYIDDESEIKKSIGVGVCTYECNEFSCNVLNRMGDKKVNALKVELSVKPPNEAPDFQPVIVQSTLYLDPKGSGQPGTRSLYSALLDKDRKASVELIKVTRITAVSSK